jgi:chemotaxis protein histidine kinase CheA/ActR/RegA family two-component response regulator
MQAQYHQRHIQSFIEEASGHLKTLNLVIPLLSDHVVQPGELEEAYRAAHSIKGVAAMLGLTSIQQTAHYLEAVFRRLMGNNLPILDSLESMMMQAVTALNTEVQSLEVSPESFSEKEEGVLEQLQPLFDEFEAHLNATSTVGVIDVNYNHGGSQPLNGHSAGNPLEPSPWDSLSDYTPPPSTLKQDEIAPMSEQPEFNSAEIDPMGDLDLDILLGDDSSHVALNEDFDIDELSNLLDAELSDFTSDFSEDLSGSMDLAQDRLLDDLDDLDVLLSTPTATDQSALLESSSVDFGELEGLLMTADDSIKLPAAAAESAANADFSDLESLLGDAERGGASPAQTAPRRRVEAKASQRPRGMEQTMRVPVKQLDSLNNLVGELVINRNSLEQEQTRLRQFLENLLYQVQHINDAGQLMRDVYERSALEMSLVNSRRGATAGQAPMVNIGSVGGADSSRLGLDALELDRFSDFHLLAQDILELIVKIREASSDIEFVVDGMEQVSRMFRQSTSQIQESLTRSRMIPFAQIADRLPRAVRDIALKSGKQAEMTVEGGETLIDKMILEQLYDPMTHLVNNAIAHGIEVPELRQAAGKPIKGQVKVQVYHQGNQTVISVSDDGAGIDPIRVKAKAIQKALISPAQAERMSEVETYDLLFHPGFSTRDQADDFAGRGVGLDVVRTSLIDIRGNIIIDSQLGKGTTFTIRLPLTLSISKALCCVSSQSRIAFPMEGVEDVIDIPHDQVQMNRDDQPCFLWRDSLLPFRPLDELLRFNRQIGRSKIYGANQDDDAISIVVLRSGNNTLALKVDQVLGEQEIAIKQLEGPAPKPFGITGATIQGDGQVMAIADILELIELGMGRARRDVSFIWEQNLEANVSIEKNDPTVLIVDDSITVRELLSMTFNKMNYRVEQARDGQEAWDKLRAGLPCDLIFCDIEMPRMDGLELLSRLRKENSLAHLPVAMLTSRGAERHRELAAQLGATAYFTKPYLEEALMEAAQKMLNGEILLQSKAALV